MEHGNIQAYGRGCHCTECRAARARYVRIRRGNIKSPGIVDMRHLDRQKPVTIEEAFHCTFTREAVLKARS